MPAIIWTATLDTIASHILFEPALFWIHLGGIVILRVTFLLSGDGGKWVLAGAAVLLVVQGVGEMIRRLSAEAHMPEGTFLAVAAGAVIGVAILAFGSRR
ncbi:hypothetical protein [Clavibacter capsici]|uniref:hypothetical protein n=1 Tax=Clavibacter capsici TaxID=1874630 RepID=UPI00142886AB|nr:hypothetical protein [Clavibacter capsici]QIS40539.1 hypothetical protein GW572_15275 [Clavibacter capsici]